MNVKDRLKIFIEYNKLPVSTFEKSIKVTNGYEATSYLGAFGKGAIPISFLAKGATMGIMNLIYNGDIMANPSLTENYYNSICRSDKMFSVKQTACRTMGADFDVFEAVLLD